MPFARFRRLGPVAIFVVLVVTLVSQAGAMVIEPEPLVPSTASNLEYDQAFLAEVMTPDPVVPIPHAGRAAIAPHCRDQAERMLTADSESTEDPIDNEQMIALVGEWFVDDVDLASNIQSCWALASWGWEVTTDLCVTPGISRALVTNNPVCKGLDFTYTDVSYTNAVVDGREQQVAMVSRGGVENYVFLVDANQDMVRPLGFDEVEGLEITDPDPARYPRLQPYECRYFRPVCTGDLVAQIDVDELERAA